MSYILVTPLAEAKNFLRVDDTLTEDDNRITLMINAAWEYIESYTNILVYARSKTYKAIDGCIRIYDYPINSYTTPVEADLTITEKTLYKTINYGGTTFDLITNVGILLPVNVGSDLKMVAEEIIDLMYYDKGDGKSIDNKLSMLSKNILDRNKRFL